MAGVLEVRNFINHNATKSVEMKEVAEFWKACTDEEKAQFSREAEELLKKS